MHQVDGGVGLQEVAPGALAGMRLAGDEQHAQILADAVEDGDGAVVGVGDLALGLVDRQFDDVAPGVGDDDLERHRLADHGALGRYGLAVDGDAHVDLALLAIGAR